MYDRIIVNNRLHWSQMEINRVIELRWDFFTRYHNKSGMIDESLYIADDVLYMKISKLKRILNTYRIMKKV